jgi:subtilase family serine protease
MRSWKFVLPLLVSSLCFAAQPDRITSPIDSSQLVPLKGNVHGLVHPGSDLGRTDGGQKIYGVTLVFHPSAAQQSDLDNLLAQQQQRSSPNYHKWLTPAQFADRFGMTKNDITRVSSWLESQGFTVTSVANSRNQISFDGTVAQVESVFATQIHNYLVDGVIHFASSTNPSVPAAMAASVLAVGHLHNFSPKPRAIVRKMSTEGADPHFTSSVSGNHFVAPADFATIYNVQPLYTAGFTGTGQTIAIIGQSTVSAADLANFRSAAGLAAKVPQYILYPSTSTATRCSGDEGESDLDLEWSNGVAQNANVVFVYAGLTTGDTCASRNNSVWNALQYAVDNNVAPVISTSYGFCEQGLQTGDPGFPATVQGWAQQANTQGQTIMAASGDDGAADCDSDVTSATQGIAVDVPASIPEVTGMGGTEFTGDAEGTATGGVVAPTQYWAGTNGADTISSALSYIPEEAWNDTAENLTQSGGTIAASGGGASILFSKPTWQTGTGVPNDGKRDVPDLALNTSPDHDGYLFCSEDGANGALQTTCSVGFRDGAGGTLAVVGGTSAAAPTFSAILTLIEQDMGSSGFGNINTSLYQFAASSSSPFHDITTGNNIVPCTNPSTDCPTTAPFQYGFSSGVGYDQVTGLGSVNANSLAAAWAASRTASSIAITNVSATNVYSGTPVTFTVAVTPSTGVGAVSFSSLNGSSTTVLGTATLNTPYPPSQTGTATFTTSALPTGSNSVTATYEGDTSDGASTSAAAAVTVTAPFTMSANPPSLSLTAGQSQVVTITITPSPGYTQAVNFVNSPNSSTGSCSGMPAGVTCTFSSPSVPLNGSTPAAVQMTVATVANMAPATGANITVTGVSGSTSVPISIGIGVAATTETVTIATTSTTVPVTAGGIASIPITVSGTNGFIVGSGSTATTQLPLSYTCTGFPSESTCTFSPSSGSNVSATAVTMSIATTAPVAQLRPPLGRGSRIFYALLLPGLLGIVFAGGSRTRTARLLGLIVVLGLSTLWMGACGGNSSSSQKNPGTPAGTYPVVVTATTGGANPLTSTFTVQLAVSN